MSTLDIVLCIAGMTAVTLLPRVLPITLLAGRKLPPCSPHGSPSCP